MPATALAYTLKPSIKPRPLPPIPKPGKASGRNARAEALKIQRLLMKDMENAETTPTQRAVCARAWEQLEERLRILRGKPLPGQLRPDLEQWNRVKAQPHKLVTVLSAKPPPPELPEIIIESTTTTTPVRTTIDASANPLPDVPTPPT